MARTFPFTLMILVASGAAVPALACPFCESSTAERVRAGIFNSDFVYHLGVSFAPFPILVAVLILIYYWPVSSVCVDTGPSPSENKSLLDRT